MQTVADESFVTYEERLNRDPAWALREGSMHFEEKSAVQLTLQKITKRLADLKIPYAVVGAMALYLHGYRRFTEDVDLLVTADGLKQIHEALAGLGYVHVFAGSKKLRDASTGVQIDFLIVGQYPGDGKPKPVLFPDPSVVSIDIDSVRVSRLETLVELKLASGMTSLSRIKDMGDVVEVIKRLKLPREFSSRLNPYVAGKFLELWDSCALPEPFES